MSVAGRRSRVFCRDSRPLDPLHDEKPQALGLLDAVNGDDVGMVQRGKSFSLAAEPLQPLGILRHPGGKNFEGDGTVELGILGLVDLAHTAFAQLGDDFEMRGLTTDQGVGQYTRSGPRSAVGALTPRELVSRYTLDILASRQSSPARALKPDTTFGHDARWMPREGQTFADLLDKAPGKDQVVEKVGTIGGHQTESRTRLQGRYPEAIEALGR